jgi:hypothetical protein
MRAGIMKKPYLKKLDQIADIKVWIVDGQYVRGRMDEEFTNFGQHFRFRFIPRQEFWIDQEHGLGEEHFFIDHLLVEHRLMSHGMAYDDALGKADAVELKERRKAELIKQISKLSRRKTLENIHKQMFKKYSGGGVNVWMVRGELVRSLYFIDFTEGGHDLVYPHFIPKNEVWLDDDHELHERHLMGLGWPYVKAHRSASRIEYHCREHPQELEANLLLEAEKNP